MGYDAHLERSDGRSLAVVRRRAKLAELSKVVPEACGVAWGIIRAQKITGAGRNIAVYLDDEINMEIGVEIDGPFDGHSELIRSALPAGTVATATHIGPYNRLMEAHQAIRRWCGEHDYKLAGPNWEVYGHWLPEWNNDPSKVRTDVFYLLK